MGAITRLASAWRRGREYRRTLGWRAFLERLLQVWLWVPRLVTSKTPTVSTIRPGTTASVQEFTDFGKDLRLDTQFELFDLTRRRLIRMESKLDRLLADQAPAIQRPSDSHLRSSNPLPWPTEIQPITKITILCRSLGRRCGIADYAVTLAQKLAATAVPTIEEVAPDTEVLLIQYEPSFYDGQEDVLTEIKAANPETIVVLESHTTPSNIPEDARWHAIIATKRSFYPGAVRLSLCLPALSESGAEQPRELRLGSFGFALPAKRYELIVDLAKRLDVPAMILAAHNNANPVIERLSASYLKQLKKLQDHNVQIIDDFMPLDEVIKRLRTCSHIVSFMEDNGEQSASLRTMALAGRPLIALRSRQAEEVGAILVDEIGAITRDFLESCRDLPVVYDGIEDYKAFLHSMAVVRSLKDQIQHDDGVYTRDPRQLERLDWLKARATGRTLDVGVGNGFSTNYIRAEVGAEIRPDRLHYASLRYPHIDFVLLDARIKVLPGFETVVLGEIIEHMSFIEAREMLAKWAQANPKRILITTPNTGKPNYDPELVHNIEHVWYPTEDALRRITPSGYEMNITTSSGEDFLLVELTKVSATSP